MLKPEAVDSLGCLGPVMDFVSVFLVALNAPSVTMCINYTILNNRKRPACADLFLLVQGAGFEPAKPKVADLQSAVFDRSTTPAYAICK